MRAALAFLAVNSFFVAVCCVFALLFFGLTSIARAIAPALTDNWWFTLPLGFIALGATLWLAYKVTLIGQQPQGRARGRG